MNIFQLNEIIKNIFFYNQNTFVQKRGNLIPIYIFFYYKTFLMEGFQPTLHQTSIKIVIRFRNCRHQSIFKHSSTIPKIFIFFVCNSSRNINIKRPLVTENWLSAALIALDTFFRIKKTLTTWSLLKTN